MTESNPSKARLDWALASTKRELIASAFDRAEEVSADVARLSEQFAVWLTEQGEHAMRIGALHERVEALAKDVQRIDDWTDTHVDEHVAADSYEQTTTPSKDVAVHDNTPQQVPESLLDARVITVERSKELLDCYNSVFREGDHRGDMSALRAVLRKLGYTVMR